MTTIAKVAQAFVEGRSAKCHNAHTDGHTYTLHRTVIARKLGPYLVEFNWGGWHTVTTANHMNYILDAMGVRGRVSYAQAERQGEGFFLASFDGSYTHLAAPALEVMA